MPLTVLLNRYINTWLNLTQLILKKNLKALKRITRNKVENHSLKFSTLFSEIQNSFNLTTLSMFGSARVVVATECSEEMSERMSRSCRAKAISELYFASACVKRVFIWIGVSSTVLFHANQTHCRTKDFARGIVLNQRHTVTRRWPFQTETYFGCSKLLSNCEKPQN